MSIFLKLSILFFPALLFLEVNKLHSQDISELQDEKAISIDGSLGASMMFYGIEGREAYRKPFVWMLTGSPTISIYGIQFPFSFIISEEQRDFRQPFNKFGVSPYYKWAKLHLGYRNLNWSPFTLAGHTIFGAGTELNPGNFQFGIIYGRLLKAVDPNDISYELNESRVETPAYERKAFSMKLGYGTERNNAGLVLLKGWDEENSIYGNSSSAHLMPAENFVLSFYTHHQLGKRIFFDLELAQSLYTQNINSSVSDSSDYGLLNIFSDLYSSNASTYSSPALESSLSWMGDQASLALRFKRIAPGYRSMGAYFFQNDLQNITLEPAFHFAEKKFNVNASLGFQKDNLDNDRPSTTNRTIGSISLTGNPFRTYNFNLSYSNYDLGQSNGTSSIDTLYEISQTTQNFSASQNLNHTTESLSHNFMLIYNYQKLKDKNTNTSSFNSYSSSMLMGNYMLSFLNIGLTASAGYNYTVFSLKTSENRIMGPVFSISKTFIDKKLSITLSDNYFRNEVSYSTGAEDRISGINRISARAVLKVSNHHRFNFKLHIKDSKAITSGFIPFNERKGDLGYVYTF